MLALVILEVVVVVIVIVLPVQIEKTISDDRYLILRRRMTTKAFNGTRKMFITELRISSMDKNDNHDDDSYNDDDNNEPGIFSDLITP